MSRGKKFKEKAKLVEKGRLYNPDSALKLVQEASFAKFNETVEAHFNLGIDPKQADQMIRGTLALPNGTGNEVRILVMAEGEKALEAKEAGADFVGVDEFIEKIQKGWLEFDLVISTPDVMAKVGRLGKALGAKGLMPNPKSGTVTADIGKAVREFKAGKIEYRNDKNGIVHVGIGKVKFTQQQLSENFLAIYDVIEKAKPSKSKGVYMRSVVLCSSMGPGVPVEPMKLKWKG